MHYRMMTAGGKMQKKIVFFDIDGTLLDHDKKLPASAKESIARLQQEGVYTAIATGRAPFMFEDLRKELKIDSFVSFNGQYVVFEGKVIYKNPLKREALEKLKDFAVLKEHPLVFMDEKTMMASAESHPFITESLGTLKFDHPGYDPDYYAGREIYQSLLFCREGEELPYADEYGDFHFIRWHDVSTDILPAGGSKAEGIKKMIKELGMRREQVFAFGDGLNDIEMLQFAGTGIAMGNASDTVKAAADLVTKDVGDNGIAYGLKLAGLLNTVCK